MARTAAARDRYRWWIAGVTLATVALSVLVVVVLPGDDRARAGAQPSVLVVGDSISANYNDVPGSPMQGWWSFVAREIGHSATVLAEPGSGYQRPGVGCTGTVFGNRPGVFDQESPDLVIVEGGRNDWARCEDRDLVPVDPDVLLAAADDFLARLTESYPDARVVVLAPPWGPLQQRYVEDVTAAVETAAARHGCEFVRMDDVLTEARTPDGVHPDINGSRAIAEVVLTALDED